jgi:hypothetical protein
MTDKEIENALKAHTVKNSAVPPFELDFTQRVNSGNGRAKVAKKVIANVKNVGSTSTDIDLITKSKAGDYEQTFGRQYDSDTANTIGSGSTAIIESTQDIPYPIIRFEDDGSGEEIEVEVTVIQT